MPDKVGWCNPLFIECLSKIGNLQESLHHLTRDQLIDLGLERQVTVGIDKRFKDVWKDRRRGRCRAGGEDLSRGDSTGDSDGARGDRTEDGP